MSYLFLNHLEKHFNEFTAVHDLSLEVNKGEFISLLGPSGCGKTTTLLMIAGFERPTSGSICIDDKDITHLKPNQRKIGIVFQSYALFPHLSVAQNISFGLEMRKVPEKQRLAKIREVLDLVRLPNLSGRYPRELSGGQQQRVALARALVTEPALLLLDEPLSNLDAKLREEMQVELRRIQSTIGTTTIIVTHDQAEALSMSDRIVIMNEGHVEQIADPYSAYETPASEFVSRFVGQTNIFEATVVESDAKSSLIDIGGTQLRIDTPNIASGAVVRVFMRPEKLYLTETLDGALPGRISRKLFLGSHWLVELDTSVGILVVNSPNVNTVIRDLTINDTVGVTIRSGVPQLL